MLERPTPKRRLSRYERYRLRLSQGVVVCPVEVDGAILGLLVRLGWLSERDASRRERVGAAIRRLLADSAEP